MRPEPLLQSSPLVWSNNDDDDDDDDVDLDDDEVKVGQRYMFAS